MSTSDPWLSLDFYRILMTAFLKAQITNSRFFFFMQKHDPANLFSRWKASVGARKKKWHNWLTFTTARGEQLSQTAGGCRCIDGRKGGGLSPSGASCPQSSSLLFVLPSDPCNSHLLRDGEAVGHGDRGQRRMHWVRRIRVAERVAGSLGVCVPGVRVAMSVMHRALGPHGGGSVSDDGGGHANRCAVT